MSLRNPLMLLAAACAGACVTPSPARSNGCNFLVAVAKGCYQEQTGSGSCSKLAAGVNKALAEKRVNEDVATVSATLCEASCRGREERIGWDHIEGTIDQKFCAVTSPQVRR